VESMARPIRRRRPSWTSFDRASAAETAFAAGFIYGLLTGEPPEEAVKLGWAHGALLTTFTSAGDTTMATVDQVRAFAQGGLARTPALEKLSIPTVFEGNSLYILCHAPHSSLADPAGYPILPRFHRGRVGDREPQSARPVSATKRLLHQCARRVEHLSSCYPCHGIGEGFRLAKLTLVWRSCWLPSVSPAYLGTGSLHPTALIPAWIGLALGHRRFPRHQSQ